MEVLLKEQKIPTQKPKNIYNFQFVLLCLSSFLFFVSFNMIIPELPAYLTGFGGENYKGFYIGLFALAALISRPFSGKLTDNIGRVPVMIIGAVVCFICGIIYPLWQTVAGFLIIRFIHGMSTGFKPIGTSAYIADIIPTNKRGEALGILGFCTSIGMGIGPYIGSVIALEFSLEVMFYTSSMVAILSILILLGMKESLTKPVKFQWKLLRINRDEIIEPKVLPVAIIMMLSVFAFGAILTVIPDLSTGLGFENKGIFFTFFTSASLFVRIIAGRASDKYGRIIVLKSGLLILVVSLVIIGYATSKEILILGSIIFGFAAGINSPTLFAWTIDLTSTKKIGRGMSTLFIALELGIILGSFISAEIYANKEENFSLTFFFCAAVALCSFFYLQFSEKVIG